MTVPVDEMFDARISKRLAHIDDSLTLFGRQGVPSRAPLSAIN
jgi:hypothetical protein